MFINRSYKWIAEIWHWLVKDNIVLMGFLILLLSVILSLYTWCNESSIRWGGYLLQFLGMVIAIHILHEVRKHFKLPSFRQTFFNWAKRFPKWKKNIVIGAGSAEIAVMGMKAQCEVWTPDDPDISIEKRIERILKNLDRIRKEQSEHGRSIEDLKKSLEGHKKKVAEENKKLRDKFQSDLESLHASDILTSLVGLVWLMVGITLSSMAAEIATVCSG